MNIADLKKNRSMSFGKITEALNKKNDYGNSDDTKYWKPERDKAGNGSATIRFLPAADGDELPWVAEYSHSFQGPTGRWYIEKCLSTIGADDPVNVFNKKLWQGSEKDKEQAKKQKRKLAYVSKILVITDSKHPENEGKVFFFKYGKKIFEKMMDKAQPTFEDETPVNVFDLWEGADFKLRIKQVDGFPNYDTSVFSDPKAVGDDDEIVEVMKKAAELGTLKSLIDPSKLKSYEELEKKLKSVLSDEVASAATASKVAEQMRSEPIAAPKVEKEKVVAEPEVKTPVKETTVDIGDDDDMTDYFASIANS